MKLGLDTLLYIVNDKAKYYQSILGEEEYNQFIERVDNMVEIVYNDGRWYDRKMTVADFLMFTEYPDRLYESKYMIAEVPDISERYKIDARGTG